MDALITQLLSYGWAGIGALVAGYAVMTLYKRNETLNDALREMSAKNAEAIASNTAALNRLSDVLGVKRTDA